MSSRDLAPPSVVILVADGARPDTLAAAIDRGDLPALGRLREEGGFHRISSVFPSVTGPAYSPFLTGRHPVPAGLPGIRWFDRARTRTRWPGHARSYVGLDMREIGRDLDPENAGELATQTAHPALQPVAAMVGHPGRHHFHQTGAIRPDHRHHKRRKHRTTLSMQPTLRNPRPKSFDLGLQLTAYLRSYSSN